MAFLAHVFSINQRDNAELGHQVNSHMQKIYKNAARTLIWLGIDDSHGKAKLAIETIKRVAPIIASRAGLADGDLNSSNDLYKPVYYCGGEIDKESLTTSFKARRA